MNDLNRRLKEVPGADVLTIERFRPNIVVKGKHVHDIKFAARC